MVILPEDGRGTGLRGPVFGNVQVLRANFRSSRRRAICEIEREPALFVCAFRAVAPDIPLRSTAAGTVIDFALAK